MIAMGVPRRILSRSLGPNRPESYRRRHHSPGAWDGAVRYIRSHIQSYAVTCSHVQSCAAQYSVERQRSSSPVQMQTMGAVPLARGAWCACKRLWPRGDWTGLDSTATVGTFPKPINAKAKAKTKAREAPSAHGNCDRSSCPRRCPQCAPNPNEPAARVSPSPPRPCIAFALRLH